MDVLLVIGIKRVGWVFGFVVEEVLGSVEILFPCCHVQFLLDRLITRTFKAL